MIKYGQTGEDDKCNHPFTINGTLTVKDSIKVLADDGEVYEYRLVGGANGAYVKLPNAPPNVSADNSRMVIDKGWAWDTGGTAENNLVHRSSNEAIDGYKSFQKSIYHSESGNHYAVLSRRTDVSMPPESTAYMDIFKQMIQDDAFVCSLQTRLSSNGRSVLVAIVRNADGTSKTVTLAEGNL